MAFIAKSILQATTNSAPKEYETIPGIAESKPKHYYPVIALLQVEKTNIVAWYVKELTDSSWKLASGFFVVIAERKRHERGAKYTVEKEAFVKKYWADIEAARAWTYKSDKWMKLVELARTEVGYSEVTSPIDICQFIKK